MFDSFFNILKFHRLLSLVGAFLLMSAGLVTTQARPAVGNQSQEKKICYARAFPEEYEGHGGWIIQKDDPGDSCDDFSGNGWWFGDMPSRNVDGSWKNMSECFYFSFYYLASPYDFCDSFLTAKTATQPLMIPVSAVPWIVVTVGGGPKVTIMYSMEYLTQENTYWPPDFEV